MKKDLVTLIKKTAQAQFTLDDIPLPPKEYKPLSPQTVNDKVKPQGQPSYNSSGFPAISEMQRALVDLVNTAASHDLDDGADLSKSNSTLAVKIKAVRDEVSRLQMVNAPKFIDGKWGPITDSALHEAVVLAISLVTLTRDYPLTVNSYSEASLDQFKDLIQQDSAQMNITDKLSAAGKITKNINLLTATYQEIKNKIKESQIFQQYKRPNITLTPEKLQDLNSKFSDMTVKVGDNQPMPITVHDIIDRDSLIAWRDKNLPHNDLKSIIEALKQQLHEEQDQ